MFKIAAPKPEEPPKPLREEILGGPEVTKTNKVRFRNHGAGLFTRAVLREKTGLSEAEIRRAIATGRLRSVSRNGQGWALYDQSSIDNLKKQPIEPPDRSKEKLPPAFAPISMAYSPAEGVAIFALISAGKRLDEAVMESGIHPAIVAAIVRDYAQLTGAILIPKELVDRMNVLPLEGTFPLTSGKDVLNVMHNAAKDHKCTICKRLSGELCRGCAKAKFSTKPAAAKTSPVTVEAPEAPPVPPPTALEPEKTDGIEVTYEDD